MIICTFVFGHIFIACYAVALVAGGEGAARGRAQAGRRDGRQGGRGEEVHDIFF